jgi:sec-independent protein translocase protein TatA
MFTQFGILDFGAPELVILAIVLLLFGGKKLPELSKGLGESIREIKKASSGATDLHNEIKGQVNDVKQSFNVPLKTTEQSQASENIVSTHESNSNAVEVKTVSVAEV